MIESLMAAALRNRVLILFVVALIVGAGAVALRTTPMDAFPDVTGVQVEVMCGAPGLSALEIERLVTHPIEIAMRGLPGLAAMRSVTKYGLSVITLVFRDDVDIFFARQVAFERLQSVADRLPEGARAEMGPVATAMGEIYQYTLEGELPAAPEEKVRYLTELRALQDWVVAPLLKSEPGVSEVNSFGGYIKEYQVVADPEKLLKYRMSIGDLYEALRCNNRNVGGSFIERGAEQFIVRGVGLIAAADDVGRIIVAMRESSPIYVRDVAEVRIGHAPRQGAALKDGRDEVVGGIVMMLKGENSRDVVRRVRARVEAINGGRVLPAGVRLKPYYDRSQIVEESTATMRRTLAEGTVLVTVVLYLLLRNLRGAAVVLAALPLAVLLTFIVMKQTGLTANLMSLGGLAISIGMIIDAAIIQVENVQRHLGALEDPARKLATVLRAVAEVRRPSIFGELIIALTFVPILSLQGMEGKMFTPLAFTVAIALLASLLLSLLVIPVLCSFFMRPGAGDAGILVRAAKRLYAPVLGFAVRAPAAVTVLALAAVAAAAVLIPGLGTEFVPVMDEGAFDMDFQLLPGVALDEALGVAREVQRRLMRFPELVTVVSRTGQTGIPLEARGVDKTGFVGMLKPRKEWRSARTREELTDRMRRALEDIPGMTFTFSQPIQCRIDELAAGSRAQVLVKLFGEDLDVLKLKSTEIARVLSDVPGCADLAVEKVSGQPYINVRIDRSRIARYGLNADDVLGYVEMAVGGKAATQVFEGSRSFDLTVRFPQEMRNSVEKLANTLVATQDGVGVPLGQVAAVALEEGPVQISRENGMRRLGIELNVSGRDIGSFVAEAQRRIERAVELPQGYMLAWGGQFENQQRAMRRLAVIVPAVAALILLLLFMTFQSARLALLVFLDLPFALAGGVFALYLSRTYLSVPASVGFIALFGVAVLNGVVLVSCIAQLRAAGKGAAEAALEACMLRLRPILMTASITIFSLLPLVFAAGPGSEVQRPLAIVVVGGLLTSTPATLLVLPALYKLVTREGGSS